MNTDPYYTIDLDTAARTMRVMAVGIWPMAMADDYARAIDRELGRYRRAGDQPNTLNVLIDLTYGGVQQREVSNRIKLVIDRYMPTARRVAMLVPDSTLHRLQVRRISTTAKHRVCSTMAEALAWLDEPADALRAVG